MGIETSPEKDQPLHALARSIVDASIPPHESLSAYLVKLTKSIEPFQGQELQPHDFVTLNQTQLPWVFEFDNPSKGVRHAIATRTLDSEKNWQDIRGIHQGRAMRGLKAGKLAMIALGNFEVVDLGNIVVAEQKLVGTADEMPFDIYASTKRDTSSEIRIANQTKPIVLPEYNPATSKQFMTEAQRKAVNVLAMPSRDGAKRLGLMPGSVEGLVRKVRANNNVSHQEMLSYAFSENLIDIEDDILPRLDWDLINENDKEFVKLHLFDTSAVAPPVLELVDKLGLKTRDQLYLAALRDGIAEPLEPDEESE